MDAFPPETVSHNLPLLVLSGLGEQDDGHNGSPAPRQESGSRIVLRSAECDSDRAELLLRQLLEFDRSNAAHNATSLPGPAGSPSYKIKRISRTVMLPSRKAAPLAQSPGEGGTVSNYALHSPLSPLSPGSPIFPDGLFTPLWFAKHQEKIPALLLVFFDMSSGDDASQNEKIQIDINAIRTTLTRSGHKTRFAAVLMSDKSILDAPEVEERLSAIRRATTLDPKTGLFFMPPMSSEAEIAGSVQNLLATLHPLCIEYYRDLTKHARRKKARGSPPAVMSPGGNTSQPLTAPGWNARYDLKQGVFAEFRQEMDVAERHYSGAIEELFNPEGVLESTPTWSHRWVEARLLCDATAIRIIRCQLWNGITTGAVLSWLNYQARMRSLVNRRGKGSGTYSWAAWEARWAEVMAALVRRAQIPALEAKPLEPTEADAGQQNFFASPERVMERLPPFQFLHHPGYWLRLAAQAHKVRRQRALLLSDQDRIPSAQLPATEIAKRANEHDVYLVPAPHEEYPADGNKGVDHFAELERLVQDATQEFTIRKQPRFAAQLQLDLAQALVNEDRQEEAMAILNPLWKSSVWRSDDWHDLFASLLALLLPCATHNKDRAVLVAATWDALGTRSSFDESLIDFSRCLVGIEQAAEQISVRVEDKELLSPLRVAFAFASKEGFVGEPLECQLTVMSHAPTGSAPLSLSGIHINIGSNHAVRIDHEANSAGSTTGVQIVDLSHTIVNAEDTTTIAAPLAFSPGETRVFSLLLNFREAEDVAVRTIGLSLQTEDFDFEHVFTSDCILPARSLSYQQGNVVQDVILRHLETTAVSVLPKPPKVDIQVHGTRAQYYTDEAIRFNVSLVNGEAERIEGVANVVVKSSSEEEIDVQWLDTEGKEMPKLILSDLEPGDSIEGVVVFHAPPVPATLTLGLEVAYTFSTEPSAQLVKTFRLDLECVLGFEAKFDVGPWLNPDPWPSYFNMSGGIDEEDKPEGIIHRWLLRSKIRSLVAEQLVIRELILSLDEEPADTKCTLEKYHHTEGQILQPHATVRNEYEFQTQKYSFDDRRASSADLSLKVVWARDDKAEACTTVLSIPRLTLPSSDPRVLCCLGEAHSEHELVLFYHLENPSAHFLTFAVTMAADEEFGFSGSKFRTLSLAPLSRYRLEYRLVLHDEEDRKLGKSNAKSERYIWPALQVLDSYYQKNLKIHPGGPGVKVDDIQGIGVLVGDAGT